MDKQFGKKRILHLLHLLIEKTDEDHPLSTAEIMDYFRQQGIVTDRKTVKADVELLQQMDYDVVAVRSTQTKYFMGSRTFELPELRLLMDAVSASRFITPTKSKVLIRKLGSLASVYQAEALHTRLYVADRVKPVNEAVYYSVEILRQAMERDKQVTFQYYEYTPKKKKVLKHRGRIYRFSPYDLIWSDDRYYALGFSVSHGKVVSFRVDRMCNVQPSEQNAVPRPEDYSIIAYGSKVFDMFDGEETEVTLSCTNDLMKVIIDRFGEGVHTWTEDDKHFCAKIKVYVSPTFYGWVFQFAGKIKIIFPDKIAHEYWEMCRQ